VAPAVAVAVAVRVARRMLVGAEGSVAVGVADAFG
jgi:hypothetical protein